MAWSGAMGPSAYDQERGSYGTFPVLHSAQLAARDVLAGIPNAAGIPVPVSAQGSGAV